MIGILSVFYAAMFIAGLIGNFAVLLIVLRNRHMRSVTNIFICNLSVADLLATIFVEPLTLLQNIFIEWRWGDTTCWCVPYLQGISVCASSLTLLVIALDRYLAICFPMRKLIRRTLAKKLIVVIWIISAILFIPWAVHYKVTVSEGVNVCHELWPSETAERFFFLGIVTILVYTAPLLIMAFCYISIILKIWGRFQEDGPRDEKSITKDFTNGEDYRINPDSMSAEKSSTVNGHDSLSSEKTYATRYYPGVRWQQNEPTAKSKNVRLQSVGGLSRGKTIKIVKMLSVVVINFCLCWLPLFTVFNIIKFSTYYATPEVATEALNASTNSTSSDVAVSKHFSPQLSMAALAYVVPFAQLLGSANSCINPWIYCFYSKTYRRGFKKVMQCQPSQRRPRFGQRVYLRENTWFTGTDQRSIRVPVNRHRVFSHTN
ncbi:hypothetical protein AAHC03_020571 [Spirometra sp. Aus1]